jgi:hypothetical protein
VAEFKGQRRRYYINQVEDALETRTRLRKSGDLAETRSRKVARVDMVEQTVESDEHDREGTWEEERGGGGAVVVEGWEWWWSRRRR